MLNRTVYISALLIILLLIAACGGQPQTVTVEVEVTRIVEVVITATPPPATTTPLPTATPESTATPAPTPTPEPTTPPTPQPDLFPDLQPLGCEYDDFKDIDYCSKYSTEGIKPVVINGDQDFDFAVYTGYHRGDSLAFMRWNIVYSGKDWIFFNQITVIADGERYSLPVDDLYDIATDTISGGVVESYDRLIEQDQSILLKIAFANEVKVRLSGRSGDYDRALTPRETEIIQRAIKTYQDKGGVFSDEDYKSVNP